MRPLGAGLNALLIPHFGPAGAAWATLAAAALFFGGWLAASQRLYPLPLRGAALAAATALFALVAVAAPALEAALGSGLAAWTGKAAVLGLFLLALLALRLLRPQAWRSVFAKAA